MLYILIHLLHPVSIERAMLRSKVNVTPVGDTTVGTLKSIRHVRCRGKLPAFVVVGGADVPVIIACCDITTSVTNQRFKIKGVRKLECCLLHVLYSD